jgi:type IV pilus assembly protein PilV
MSSASTSASGDAQMTSTTHERGRSSGEDGFTIIEVMIAMVILVVGVLGTVVLLEGSMSSTARTTAREQGTNVARDLVERSRQFAYSSMTMVPTAAIPASATNPGAPATPGAPTVLRNSLPASDNATAVTGSPPNSTFDVTRRNTTYTVTVFACSVDDPSDGIGVGDATFCAGSNGVVAPGNPPPGVASSINILGIGIAGLAAGGSLLQTVCNATGPGNPITAAVTGLVSNVAPISLCPTAVGSTSTVAYDASADDMRRVRIDVSWSRSGYSGSVSQTTVLTNPLQN